MIREEQIKQPCCFCFFPEFLDIGRRCPTILLQLSLDNVICGNAFILNPIVHFRNDIDCFGAQPLPVPWGDSGQ